MSKLVIRVSLFSLYKILSRAKLTQRAFINPMRIEVRYPWNILLAVSGNKKSVMVVKGAMPWQRMYKMATSHTCLQRELEIIIVFCEYLALSV